MEENKILKIKELKDRLLEISNEESVNQFFRYMYNNFGGGLILPDEHIVNIFQKNLNSHNLFVEYYIDTYRTLGLMSKDTDVLLTVEQDDLFGFHHEITQEFKAEADDELKNKFTETVNIFESYVEDNENYQVGIINSVDELDWEGKYMNHCIATYRYIVANGEYVGFKFFNKNSWERLTLGCYVRDGKLIFNQLKAHSNYPASEESRKFAIEYCEKFNIACDKENYDLKF